ncbi:MAG: LacI family DNA-binding transcriptional regulator [Alphaproteobacteria bacterium]|nr:LacI family DNA-binding transcriptional regulator [Alphaproteobacteria bacterium]
MTTTSRRRAGAARAGARAGIADVARLAGVSTATVSRALASPGVVSATTRDRVLQAVRETGYTPHVAAQNLRARRTMMVLVVVPDIANPFFAEVLHGIEDTLAAAGYGLLIGNLANSVAKEGRYVDLVFAGQVDGVLLLNGGIPASAGRGMAESGVPIVAACEAIPKAPFPQVEIQNREASIAVAALLAQLGHRRFAYIAGPRGNVLEKERNAGFRKGLAAAGFDAASLVQFDGDFTFRAGADAARRFMAMQPRPTAVYAANDEMAIGFLKAVRAAGIQVPRDVSVVGFDGIDYADYAEPTLTTVRQPRNALGATAAGLLIDLMTGKTRAKPGLTRLEISLLVRGSTGPAPGATTARGG